MSAATSWIGPAPEATDQEVAGSNPAERTSSEASPEKSDGASGHFRAVQARKYSNGSGAAHEMRTNQRYRLAMSIREPEPSPTGETFWSRARSSLRSLARRPVVLVGWAALATATVIAQHLIAQPFSAAAYPVALVLALSLARSRRS